MKKSILVLFAMLVISNIVDAGEWIKVNGGSLEIDLREKDMEDSLWEFLGKVDGHEFYPREDYTYQYQANIKDGQEELYINALCMTDEIEKYLDNQFIIVFDGGSCFFQVRFNLKTGKFYDLSVNGEA